ncbi:MAG: hypothetical protein EBS01_06030 [Verrucomicrobia bacterium]|nr:hypothetical protein [Verrucomicrobiota bacterium]
MLKKPRQTGAPLFWALLVEVERLTQLERAALGGKNYAVLEELHQTKRGTFSHMAALGARLGLNRSNAELRSRLEALERLELANCRDAQAAVEALRGELTSLASEAQSLKSFRDAYAGEPETPEFQTKC